MSWLTQYFFHRRCLQHQRQLKPLELPKPLDLVVFVYDDADALRNFFDSIVRNTRWPLRIHLCDAIAEDESARELLKLWDGKRAGLHEVRALYKQSRNYPETVQAALKTIQSDVFLIGESRVTVPALAGDCWATRLLKTMERYPHTGWLNAALQMPALPGLSVTSRKSVWGTDDHVLRDAPRTQLALIRNDYLKRNQSGDLQLDKTFYAHPSGDYYTGCCPDVITVVHLQDQKQARNKSVEYGLPFYIITRTHARPDLFAQCRNSIERQTSFDRIIHVVTYEDEKDLQYIPADCAKVKITPNPDVPCWYETYINDALDTIHGPGLVMFLDDDDYLVNGNFVETALTAAAKCDALFFRTNLHAGRDIPSFVPFASPPFGDIASCSYVLRLETAKQARWEAGHGGDFRYLNQIFYAEVLGRQTIAWCSDVLTATQRGRSKGRTGHSAKALKYHDSPIQFYTTDSRQQLVRL